MPELPSAYISPEEWEIRRETIKALLARANPQRYIRQILARILEPGIFTPTYHQLRNQLRVWLDERVMELPWSTEGSRRDRVRNIRAAMQVSGRSNQNDTTTANVSGGASASSNNTTATMATGSPLDRDFFLQNFGDLGHECPSNPRYHESDA
ncbi:hypothetical protein V499_01976 [Pseudogymnoascus sp. VKM F-103]|nr:hypothetical protein V499_01976 [Pseudogymnoascus sp. VKM F-103]